MSAASSTSNIIHDKIDHFQKINQCCGYSHAFDYCCQDQFISKILPTYINEIEPIEDKIEVLRLELEKQNVTRDMKEIKERNNKLDLELIDLGLIEWPERTLETADYIDGLPGNESMASYMYYDELPDEALPKNFYDEQYDTKLDTELLNCESSHDPGFYDPDTKVWYKKGSVCPILGKLHKHRTITFPEMQCKKDPINPGKYLTVEVSFRSQACRWITLIILGSLSWTRYLRF